MADHDHDKKDAQQTGAPQNSVLQQQAQGETGAGGQGFSGVAGSQYRSPEQVQGQSQSGAPGRGAFQGGQGATQQTFAQQGETDQQRFGATSDQIGLNQQSYGQNVEQDTSGGLGGQQAKLAAAGSSEMLGEGPAQSAGQPASPTTGGPDLSKGLTDTNKS